MSNLNRARLTREQSDVQCYYAKFQLDCAFKECDEKCPILKQVYQKIRERVNRDIETVCDAENNRYSPSWQHTRNQPGSNFPREG